VRLLKKPTLLYVRYHPFTPSPTIIARILRVPSLLEVNGALDDFVEIWDPPKPITSIVLKTIAPSLRAASAVIAVAEELAEHVQQTVGIEPDRLHVVDNGVNTGLFRPLDSAECRKKLGLKQDARIVTFVGTLSVYQGLDTLLDACEQLVQAKGYDIRTLIVGDGALRTDVERTISEKNLENCVTLVGRVPLEDVPQYVCAGDACVAPFAECVSTAGGFSPLKVYEYMACGKAVVASDFSCFSNVLSEGPCGLVTEPGNATALSQAVLRLLENPAEAEQMGRRGRELVEKRFTWDIATDKIVDIMTGLIRTRKVTR
jgi:glycosyltransferase involved in cell wall biosynthesis